MELTFFLHLTLIIKTEKDDIYLIGLGNASNPAPAVSLDRASVMLQMRVILQCYINSFPLRRLTSIDLTESHTQECRASINFHTLGREHWMASWKAVSHPTIALQWNALIRIRLGPVVYVLISVVRDFGAKSIEKWKNREEVAVVCCLSFGILCPILADVTIKTCTFSAASAWKKMWIFTYDELLLRV